MPAGTPAVAVQEPRLAAEQETVDVAVVGLGYVGLPTALGFTALGKRVAGIELSEARRASILAGRVDLLLKDGEELLAALANGRLEVSDDARLIAAASVVVICVPTPVDEHLVPDLRPLRAACSSVAAHARRGSLVMLTSTSYVGTTRELLAQPLEARGFKVGTDVNVAFCPERIDPGPAAWPRELVPRVVGGITARCSDRAAEVTSSVCRSVHVVSSAEAAEMTKLLENSFRAVNIAFANEVSDICNELNLDIGEVIDAAATKPFGFMPFRPGPGAGGHCIPVDPHYLLWELRSQHLSAPVTESAMAALSARPHLVVERMVGILSERGIPLRGTRIVVVGVTYKPDVDDVRGSPALEIIEELRQRGAAVSYVDSRLPRLTLGDGTTIDAEPASAIESATAVLVHTLHTNFDTSHLAHCGLVVDATYKLSGFPGRVPV